MRLVAFPLRFRRVAARPGTPKTLGYTAIAVASGVCGVRERCAGCTSRPRAVPPRPPGCAGLRPPFLRDLCVSASSVCALPRTNDANPHRRRREWSADRAVRAVGVARLVSGDAAGVRHRAVLTAAPRCATPRCAAASRPARVCAPVVRRESHRKRWGTPL